MCDNEEIIKRSHNYESIADLLINELYLDDLDIQDTYVDGSHLQLSFDTIVTSDPDHLEQELDQFDDARVTRAMEKLVEKLDKKFNIEYFDTDELEDIFLHIDGRFPFPIEVDIEQEEVSITIPFEFNIDVKSAGEELRSPALTPLTQYRQKMIKLVKYWKLKYKIGYETELQIDATRVTPENMIVRMIYRFEHGSDIASSDTIKNEAYSILGAYDQIKLDLEKTFLQYDLKYESLRNWLSKFVL